MEPLIKNENFNITFYKKMLEKIKQCKDALRPDSEEANQVGIYSLVVFQLVLRNTRSGTLLDVQLSYSSSLSVNLEVKSCF